MPEENIFHLNTRHRSLVPVMRNWAVFFCSVLLGGALTARASATQDEIQAEQLSEEIVQKEYPRFKIAFDVLGLLGHEAAFQLEYLLPKQSVSIRVPAGFIFTDEGFTYTFIRAYSDDYSTSGDGDVSSHYNKGKGFHTGMDFLIYFNRPRKVRPYFAPGFFTGIFVRNYERWKIELEDGRKTYTRLADKKMPGGMLGIELKLGMQILMKRNISVAIEGGAGYGSFFHKERDSPNIGIRRISLLVGYHWNRRKSVD